jgi:hypothetical protein
VLLFTFVGAGGWAFKLEAEEWLAVVEFLGSSAVLKVFPPAHEEKMNNVLVGSKFLLAPSDQQFA